MESRSYFREVIVQKRMKKKITGRCAFAVALLDGCSFHVPFLSLSGDLNTSRSHLNDEVRAFEKCYKKDTYLKGNPKNIKNVRRLANSRPWAAVTKKTVKN